MTVFPIPTCNIYCSLLIMVSHVTTNYQRQLQDLSNTYCLSINPINLTDLDKLTHASSTGQNFTSLFLDIN